jgi:hypothetical protein
VLLAHEELFTNRNGSIRFEAMIDDCLCFQEPDTNEDRATDQEESNDKKSAMYVEGYKLLNRPSIFLPASFLNEWQHVRTRVEPLFKTNAKVWRRHLDHLDSIHEDSGIPFIEYILRYVEQEDPAVVPDLPAKQEWILDIAKSRILSTRYFIEKQRLADLTDPMSLYHTVLLKRLVGYP